MAKEGRFGVYVTDGETNASIARGDRIEEMTPERAYELLAIRRETAGERGPAKKKPAAVKKAGPARKKPDGEEVGGEEGGGAAKAAGGSAKKAVAEAGRRRPTEARVGRSARAASSLTPPWPGTSHSKAVTPAASRRRPGALAEAIGAVLTREPGGTTIGELVRGVLLDPAHDAMVDRAEALLYAADRAQHLAEVVEPALGAGPPRRQRSVGAVVCRLPGLRPGLGAEAVWRVNDWAIGGRWPDLAVLLDVRPVRDAHPARSGPRTAWSRPATGSTSGCATGYLADGGRRPTEALGRGRRQPAPRTTSAATSRPGRASERWAVSRSRAV